MPDPTAADQSPEEFSRDRLDLLTKQAHKLSGRLNRIVRIKRTCIGVVIAYGVITFSALEVVVPLFIMLVPVVVFQNRIARKLKKTRRSSEFYRRAVARIDGQWIGDGEDGQRYLDDNEVFADDLDLFGHASLFQFLNTASTAIGRQTLADWLSQPADADEIRERQVAVRELAGNCELRERLALLDLNRNDVDSQAVTTWANVPRLMPDWRTRVAGFVLAVAVALAAVGLGATAMGYASASGFQFPVSIAVAVIAAELIFYAIVRVLLKPISANGLDAVNTLSYLSAVGSSLRKTSFTSQRLSELQLAITNPGTRSRIGRAVYRRTTDLPLALLFLCQLIPGIDRWRRSKANSAQNGLLALGELEAIASLAQYAFIQPETTFPEVVTTTCYEAVGLGHPLIPESERVRNDLQLNPSLRLLLVSGSNMSGKSTMLRAVGVNAVLALCGAPVCASEFRISPFSIGTAMRFSDSLEHKTSYFFAVITRLRRVMELQDEERPLLFLIDEILQGTNSGDRIEGSEAIVRKLTDRGGVGMVTTHDLELTRIVETFDGRAANVHFVDHLVDGEIQFDYKMQPGVVRTSNALRLMRSMGLDV